MDATVQKLATVAARTRVREGRPYPLGASWDGVGVNFALFSAHATKVDAAIDSVNSVWRPTEAGDCASLAVVSRGEYGVPEGLVFGYPVRSTGDSWSVAEDFDLDDFAKDKIRITTEELVAERDEVQALL